MTDAQRALLVRLKGLLVLAVDLIDQVLLTGKYKVAPVVIGTGDTVTWTPVQRPESVTTSTEKEAHE